MSPFLPAIGTLIMLGGLVFAGLQVPPRVARRVWLVAFVWVLGGAVTMMSAHAFVAKWAFKGDSARDGLTALMDGTAHRPFVYRRLAPEIIRRATDVAMARLPGTVEYLEKRSHLARYHWTLDIEESWNARKAVAFHVAYALTWLSLFGTLLMGAALHRHLHPCLFLEAFATACLVMCLVPLMFVGGGYVYDAPELFLWTTTLLFAMQGRLWAVLPAFALMLLNKESAILAVPTLFPILLRRCGLVRAAICTIALAAIGCAWLWFVRTKFALNPGQPGEWWFPSNAYFWARPQSYFLFSELSSPALPSPRGANIVTLVLIFLPLRFGWRSLPAELRQATAILTVLLLPLFLAYGYRDEVRALSLLYPLLVAATIEGVHAMFKIGLNTAEDGGGSGASL